jgi:hypothetical protein
MAYLVCAFIACIDWRRPYFKQRTLALFLEPIASVFAGKKLYRGCPAKRLGGGEQTLNMEWEQEVRGPGLSVGFG